MLEAIIQKVVPGGQLHRSWPLKGGIVAEMTAVEAVGWDGQLQKFVVRQHKSAVYEYRVLGLTSALGLNTADPIYLHESDDGPALVASFIDGVVDFGTRDVDGYVRQMAEVLAELHSADLSTHELSFLKQRKSSCVEFGRVEPYLGADGLAMGLDVGRIEDVLARGLPGRENRPRLLHGDYWAGNMLWRDGRLSGVVDWEDAGLGEPLIDLAAARVELVWLFGMEPVDRFLEVYHQISPIDLTNLPYWDLCAVLRLLRLVKGRWQWLVDFVVDFDREDITSEKIGREIQTFVARALERLDSI